MDEVDCPMIARPKIILRFLFLLGFLLLEAGLVIAFYVIPKFHSHEAQSHQVILLPVVSVLHKFPGLRILGLGFWGILALGNAGLILLVWRAFKNLWIEPQETQNE